MIEYKRLRHILIDRGIKVSDMCSKLGISRPTQSKLNKDEYVSLDTLERIAKFLECEIGDIVEIKKD